MKDRKLLVMIDDDTDDHEIFDMAISEIDGQLKILFFSDCESALAHFQDPEVDSPEYVFIDLQLPRISGGRCLQKLQKLSEFDHPRIIIYSTSIPEEWREELKSIGVDKFLEKSGSIPALIENLKRLLQR